ncbi:hypothetical protein BDZ89DRAFT_1073027 [Hymenopellis radicata]|nr:hypothetical protein BDZ89DRAFT_1073027 [Hymenopellis radicata]
MILMPPLENPAMTDPPVIAAAEPPPPSYESVLNADFGEPSVRPPSPPLPPIPVAEPIQSVPRHSPPPQHPQRAPNPAPATPPSRTERPSRRSAREPRQRPQSSTLPRHPPAYASLPGPPPGRRRSQSEARVRPRRARRATSPGPHQRDVDAEVARRRHHTQSLPAASPSPTLPGNPIPAPLPGRARPGNRRTLGSVQELLTLTESRRASFFASNKKTARLVRSSVLDFTTQLDDTSDVEEMLGTLERACTMCNLNLGSILREGKVDGHSPLYWAVVRGHSDPVLKALLKHSPGGMDEEIRLASIIRSDWKLYQRLRTWLGIPGRVKVEETYDGKGFAVHLQDLSADAGVEFIARGRLWRLAFPVGNVSISLLSHSPQTFIDANLRVFSSPSVEVPLKSPHLLQPPDRKGRVKAVSSPIPINIKLGQARLDVRMTKPAEDAWCVIC